MERNRTLDRLRAFAMLWTVLIHVLYFGAFFTSSDINAVKSWLLLEMPLIFFIMGAGNAMSRDRAYHSFVFQRWGKMLVPYWVYAAICIGIILADQGRNYLIIGKNIWEVALSWLIPLDQQISHLDYLTWAIWFVPVYLCMVLLMPLFKKAAASEWRVAWGFILGMVYLTSLVLGSDLLQKVAFYSLFVYFGHFYTQWEEELSYMPMRGFLWAMVVMTLTVLMGLLLSGVDMDMQFRKFPPDPIFLLFSVGSLSSVLLMAPHIDSGFATMERCRPLRFLIDLYAKHSLTVFLYQPLFFMWAVPLCKKLITGPNFGSELARMLLCLAMAIPACALPALLLGWLEKFPYREPKQ